MRSSERTVNGNALRQLIPQENWWNLRRSFNAGFDDLVVFDRPQTRNRFRLPQPRMELAEAQAVLAECQQ
jgi:hypothetical protein